MNKTSIGLLILCAVMSTACSHLSQELDGYHEGWRRATVLEVGLASVIEPDGGAQDCRPAWSDQGPAQWFAVTSYAQGGSVNTRQRRIVALPDGLSVRAGDQVAIHLSDCRLPLRAVSTSPEWPR